jgi:PAS domain S-box-containing protein
VTERSKAQRALQESEQRYQVLYEDNPTMFFTLAPDGTVLSVNRYGAEQLGYTAQELTNRSVLEIFDERDRRKIAGQLSACLDQVKQTITWEVRKICKDGTRMWVKEFARAVPDPKGNLVILIVCEDITERKLTEKALRRAEKKMQMIQAARERLAHDLHDNIIQQLYAIGMGLEECRYRIQEEAGSTSISTSLKHTIGELNFVIEEVRNFLGGKDALHTLDSQSIAAQFQKLVRRGQTWRGPKISVHIGKGIIEKLPAGQARHLYLIAQEAVSNILRHSNATDGYVRLREEKGTMVLTVHDNGVGFDPTRPAAGRLGLKTMKTRAKKIGARFELRSRASIGTHIHVMLPKETQR